MTNYTELIFEKMFKSDAFSKWMGMELVDVDKGRSVVRMTVRPEMCNGFGIAHGGISYSLADSALAFACNTYEGISVSIETSISHLKPIYPGDILVATAREESRSRKIGVYSVEVKKEEELIAHFKGTIYHK